jgi:hypothetical protein
MSLISQRHCECFNRHKRLLQDALSLCDNARRTRCLNTPLREMRLPARQSGGQPWEEDPDHSRGFSLAGSRRLQMTRQRKSPLVRPGLSDAESRFRSRPGFRDLIHMRHQNDGTDSTCLRGWAPVKGRRSSCHCRPRPGRCRRTTADAKDPATGSQSTPRTPPRPPRINPFDHGWPLYPRSPARRCDHGPRAPARGHCKA